MGKIGVEYTENIKFYTGRLPFRDNFDAFALAQRAYIFVEMPKQISSGPA